jgi:hypothetical protein
VRPPSENVAIPSGLPSDDPEAPAVASTPGPLRRRVASSTIIAPATEFTRQLLRQQDELQAEAEAVGFDLQLDELLRPIGEPVRVGSAVLGVMVRRDLDLAVVCTELDIAGKSCRRSGVDLSRQVAARAFASNIELSVEPVASVGAASPHTRGFGKSRSETRRVTGTLIRLTPMACTSTSGTARHRS